MKAKNKKHTTSKEISYNADHISPDADADKTGTDKSSDSTGKGKGANKFDKSKREVDPDRTGIDINADKTRKKDKPGNLSLKADTKKTPVC